MPYCAKCGVELKSSKVCPLCHYKVPEDLYESIAPSFPKAKNSYSGRIKKRRYRMAFSLSLFFIIVMLFMFFLNYKESRTLTWSKNTNSSLLFTWLTLMTLFQMTGKNILKSLLKFYTILFLFLFLLDLNKGGITWSFPFGLCLVVLFGATSALAVVIAKKVTRKHFFLILAFYALLLELFFMGLSIILGVFVFHGHYWGFSLYTLIPLVGIALILMYFNYDMNEEVQETMSQKLHF